MNKGVTLVELLVAITLLGMVSLGLLMTMRVGSAAWQRGTARLIADRQTVAAADLLVTQLANVQARRVRWGPRERPVSFLYFEGAADRLRFLTSYGLEARSRAGVWLAEYSFRRGTSDSCELAYQERPYRDDTDVAATIAQASYEPQTGRPMVEFALLKAGRRLYDHLEKCTFEYLIEPPQKDAYWAQSWPVESHALPRSVAVRFHARDAAGVRPVALVATLNVREP